MEHRIIRHTLAALFAMFLFTSAALAQPKGIPQKRMALTGMAKYNLVMKRIIGLAAASSGAPRALATASNSTGQAQLMLSASPNRGATATGAQQTESGSSVVCESRPFHLDFTTVGSFDIFKLVDESKLYPGAIVSTNSVLNSGFANVSNLPARKPISLYLDLLSANGQPDIVTVQGPINGATVNSARNTLVNNHTGATIPTQAAATAQSFTASSEVAAEIQTSAGALVPLEELGIPANLSLERSLSGSVSATGAIERYTVSLFEPMYTVSVGETGGALFQDASAANGVEGAMISSVTYGRVLFLYIEGIGGSAKLQAFFRNKLGLDLALEEGPVNIGADQSGSASASAEFQITSMKATIIGGNSSEGNALTAAILTGENAKTRLRNYVNARSAQTLSAATAARPIAFTMVYVKNNASLGVRFTTDGDILFGCRPTKKLRIEMVSMKATRVVDNPIGTGGDNEDLFGEIEASISSAHILAGASSKKMFDYSRSAPLRLKQGQSESINKVLEATIDPNDIGRFRVNFSESVKDDYDGAEQTVNPGKTSASYEFTGGTNAFDASELNLLSSGGTTTKVLKLQESGGEPKLEVTVRFSLVE